MSGNGISSISTIRESRGIKFSQLDAPKSDARGYSLETYELSWKTRLNFGDNRVITSPRYTMHLDEENESVWRFELEHYKDLDGTPHLSFFAVLDQSKRYPQPAMFEIHFMDTDSTNPPGFKSVYKKVITYTEFTAEHPAHGYHKFVPYSLLGPSGKPDFKDKLSVCIIMKLFVRLPELDSDFTSESILQAEEFKETESETEQPPPLFDRHADPLKFDALLKFEGEQIEVSTERLNYYTGLFENNFITLGNNKQKYEWETAMDLVELPIFEDVTLAQFKNVIHFCHYGALDNPPEPNRMGLVKVLLRFSKQLQISQLHTLMEENLFKNHLTVDKFMDIVILATEGFLSKKGLKNIYEFMLKSRNELSENEEYRNTYEQLKHFYVDVALMCENIAQ